MNVKTEFQKRTFQTPFVYKLVEGITTLMMPIGHVIAGGSIFSTLFIMYLLHAMASLSFHLFPSELTYWLDVCMINFLIMERVYFISGNLFVYPIYLTSMFMETIKSHVHIIVRVLLLILFVSSFDMYDVSLWIICFITFIQSFYYCVHGDAFKTTLTCCLYHFYLGVLSALEVRHHPSITIIMITERFDLLFRFCMYYLFLFYVVYGITDKPKRLRNVMTLLSATILTPLSFYEIWWQIQSPQHIYQDEIQTGMVLWFISYAIVDLIVGSIFYPQYTTLLEAWLHHIGFTLTLTYYLRVEKLTLCCMCMVIETSTVVLSLFKIFYDCPWILWLRDNHFTWMFCLFRIWFPTFFILYFYNLLVDNLAIFVYVINMILNSYWLRKQYILSKNNSRNK